MEFKVNKKLIFVLGALGGLLYGYDNGVISGALLFINNDIPLTSFTQGLVVSSMLIGAIIGAGLSGPISDKLGRRKVVFIIAIIYIIGSLLMAVANSVDLLVIGRLVIGLGVGSSTAIIPVYLSEMAPTKFRGSLAALNPLMITIGILVAYCTNFLLADAEAWRWMIGLAVVPAIILLIGVIFMPESPRWLLENRSETAARHVMSLTFKQHEIEKEINDMKNVIHNSESAWKLLRAKWVRPVLIIGCLFAFFQQIIGINAIIYYTPLILTKAGLGSSSSILGTVGLGIVNVLVTILSIVIIDKIDRKKLLVIGNIGMIISLLIMTITIATMGITQVAWIIIICLSLFILFFGATWGPIMWVMLPEMFPTRARGAATGIAIVVLQIGTLIISQVFPILVNMLEVEYVFLIFAVIGALALIFVVKFLPETRGKSLEEIELQLQN
ncbi:sugar porter family MFS transporter [Staphylococcus pseudoxylosus]|uniref:sugar porter family MFS transporter n=1 Tax=Staphylococcus pseudoxylosus TaxID=2282419 RepID=UPI002DB90FE4|nr:sugar porter family MFS transporter [Staphylococcus pseudoxylosus]MEB6036556.1 sugar porter family MFS transporter [Staphylococcus pseudoxylosus]MEB7763508.1 sugar porter family MFS transporter [Staphylococcus pseudoxylosus]MEB8085913.1 sugar porter family MFS transporter [Staphylococcus pseudoxylosus]